MDLNLTIVNSILLYLISLLPLVEPRYGVIIGLKLFKLDSVLVLVICILATLTLSMLLPLIMNFLENCLVRRIGFVNRLYIRYIEKVQATVNKSKLFKVSALLGVYIFVMVPVPASGMWTGAIISKILGFRYSEAVSVLFLGGLTSLLLTFLTVRVACL